MRLWDNNLNNFLDITRNQSDLLQAPTDQMYEIFDNMEMGMGIDPPMWT
jgi:hypothetical protein